MPSQKKIMFGGRAAPFPPQGTNFQTVFLKFGNRKDSVVLSPIITLTLGTCILTFEITRRGKPLPRFFTVSNRTRGPSSPARHAFRAYDNRIRKRCRRRGDRWPPPPPAAERHSSPSLVRHILCISPVHTGAYLYVYRIMQCICNYTLFAQWCIATEDNNYRIRLILFPDNDRSNRFSKIAFFLRLRRHIVLYIYIYINDKAGQVLVIFFN